MINIYKTNKENNSLEIIQNLEKKVWINMINPTEEEINNICASLKIEKDLLVDALDDEEKARIEYDEDENIIGFIVDSPIVEREGNNDIYSTIPLGIMVVRNEYLITICLKKVKAIDDLENNISNLTNTNDYNKMILQIFFKNATEFIKALGKINSEKNRTEKKLKSSMKNKELLKMLGLEKSLVYITTALRSNEVVLERTRKGKALKLSEEEYEILEDVIIENRQAIEMAKIYSDTLSGIMDAYASIISNNLNIVMKFLTSITIIMSIPTILSGYWGMNLRIPFEDSYYGFYIVVGLSVILSALTVWWFKKRDMLS